MSKPRTLADRYELTSPIARGGMGQVWAAYDKRLDRRVAVKLFRPDAFPSSVDVRALAMRFVREARLTARVEHPGVPAVFDAGAEGDRLYLVMQLMPGVDLADFLAQRGRLPIEWAAAIAAQIASVLAAAHAVSLVHRDLKPRNIMIRPDGSVVVLDFGVAALLDADITGITATGEALGSPAYMSPEQVKGVQASPRSDLYALGCVMHELLAGSRPFMAEGTYAAMREHAEVPPPALRSLRADVPEELERLALDLLAKEPEGRPADAQEVYERLLPFLPAPSASEGDGGTLDPTRPYRQPLAPEARRSPRATPAAPVIADEAPIDISRARDEAAALAEAGRFTQAAELLTSVLARADGREARGARLQLANTLLLGGDYARALPEYGRLIADVGAERGFDDADVLAWRVQAATCKAALGQPAEAVELLTKILDVRRHLVGRDAPEIIELRRQIALLRASAGQAEQAEVELRELVDELDAGGPEAAELAEVLRRLGRT